MRQEAWLRSALFFHQCDRTPRGWLFRIARNASVDHLKQCAEERRLGVAFGEAPEESELITAPAARLHSPEELYLHRIIYARQLGRLSAEQLIVLQLRDEGYDYQEIFLRTGIPPIAPAPPPPSSRLPLVSDHKPPRQLAAKIHARRAPKIDRARRSERTQI